MNDTSKNGNLNKQIGLPLLIWGTISMIAGLFFFFSTSELINGILFQAFLWGLIDGIIGLIAYLRKKEFNLGKIKKILLVNVYLDVLYVVIGILLVLFNRNAFLIGNGYGIIIQGLFLFIIDLIHHRNIKQTLS